MRRKLSGAPQAAGDVDRAGCHRARVMELAPLRAAAFAHAGAGRVREATGTAGEALDEKRAAAGAQAAPAPPAAGAAIGQKSPITSYTHPADDAIAGFSDCREMISHVAVRANESR
jgi:hypothetical protein